MTDNQIIKLLGDVLDPMIAACEALVRVDAMLVQNYQPRQQGMSSTVTLYFHKVSDHRYGFKGASDVYVAPTVDDPVGYNRHTETQFYETRFQFMAIVPQDGSDVTELTESDVLNTFAGIIASDAAIEAFSAGGLGVQRITDVTNPYFRDEKDRWEASPSFDVVFTYRREHVTNAPVVTSYGAAVNRV